MVCRPTGCVRPSTDFRSPATDSPLKALRQFLCSTSRCLATGLLVFLNLQHSASSTSGAEPVVARIAQLAEQLVDADFRLRRAAAMELRSLQGEEMVQFVQQLPFESAEATLAAVRVLERIFQADAGSDGELAERALEFLSRRDGPWAAAARDALVRNYQLRESRARVAIERLGGAILDYDPTRIADHLTPPPNAPGVGVGFGPNTIPAAILLLDTWTGGPADLWHIRRFATRPRMVVYVIRGSGIDPLRVRAAAASITDLAVEERGSASLGIKNSLDQDGCNVGSVLPFSAAMRAGLQEHDRILTADGIPIQSFHHLVFFLLGKKPNDMVQLTVERRELTERGWQSKVLKMNVKLGSWRYQRDPETYAPPPPPFQGPEGPDYIQWVDRPPPVPLPVGESRRFM